MPTANPAQVIEKLLTADEVADLLGVPVHSIYAWRATGRSCPPGLRVGRYLRFRREDVQQWIDSRVQRAED